MSSCTNLSHLIEKKIFRKLILGTYHETGLKETNDECNFENVFTGPDPNDTTENKEETSEVSASKDDLAQTFCGVLTKRKSNEELNGMSLKNENPNDNEDHDDKTANRNSNVTEDTRDEVDYFDSDEEFLETLGVRFDEIDVPDEYDEYFMPPASRGGRYSEGIYQFENLPVYRRSIQKFAKANQFEIYDIIPDGNCMFRALSDQFMINGRLGYTADLLRTFAVEYLRKHPYKEDGHHIQSFLYNETWEDYLERMSRTKEWGDHIILQALVDAFYLNVNIFNVFEDDVRQNVLQPGTDTKRYLMQVSLGHVGEFHYLSLRPCRWTELWPYKSLMYRSIVCSQNVSPSAIRDDIKRKITALESIESLSEQEFVDMFEFHQENACICSMTGLQHKGIPELYFKKYMLNEKELQETENAEGHTLSDPLHIDVLTGIPLLHLSFLFKILVPMEMVLRYNFVHSGILRTLSKYKVYSVGSKTTGFDAYLKDISNSQKKRKYYISSSNHGFTAAIVPQDKIVQHRSSYHEDLRFRSIPTLLADSSQTHVGYCQVQVLLNDADVGEHVVVQRGDEKYLKEIKFADRDLLPPHVTMVYNGLQCETFPPEAQEWIDRKRKFSFPSRQLVEVISYLGCTLIQKAHPLSSDPDIEWKYDFSLANYAILNGSLSIDQKHGFYIFKILIENVCSHLKRKLKIKHLTAVYFRALEELSDEMWKSNFSGCILFAVESLVACLKARYLPHYFIQSNNLIDSFSAKETNDIRVNVECIRMFPLLVLQFTAENHGYNFAQKLIEIVMKDCASFQHNKDVMTLFTEALIPGTLGVMRVFTRRGFYGAAFQQLVNLQEQMLFVEMPTDCHVIPEFIDVFETALRSFRQKSTRVNLSLLFEKYTKNNVLCKIIDERSTFAKDVLPWKTRPEIEWMEIPPEKVSDLSTLAEYFFSCGIKECDKRNKTLATATLETAITCLQKCIQTDTICPNNIEDEELKEEVFSQRDAILLKFKRQLMSYYIHLWRVSKFDWNVEPLMGHMGDIEKLCLDLPDKISILVKMFRYVRMYDKAREYKKKAYLRKR